MSRPPRQLTWVEAAEEQCAVLVSAHLLTPAEFWHGDYSMLKYYRMAYRKMEDRKNREAWLQGMYVYDAICDVSPILRAFSKAKKPLPYPDEPYDLHMGESPVEAEQREHQEYESKKTKMEILAATWNAQFAKRKKVNDNAG